MIVGPELADCELDDFGTRDLPDVRCSLGEVNRPRSIRIWPLPRQCVVPFHLIFSNNPDQLAYCAEKRARTVDGSEEDVEASRKHARMDGDLGGMDDQNWFIPDEYGGGDYAGAFDPMTHCIATELYCVVAQLSKVSEEKERQSLTYVYSPLEFRRADSLRDEQDVEQGREGRESGENARAEVVFPWNADLMTSDAGAGGESHHSPSSTARSSATDTGLGGFGDGASSNKSRSAKVSLNIPQASVSLLPDPPARR